MSITASSNTKPRTLIPAGNYIARCYSQIEIGTVEETYQGDDKIVKKVRIGWELPLELKVFDEAKGPQPLVISKEYTLSLGKKANLRHDLDSWRGIAFTEDQAKSFDVTKLLGVPCMLNIIHKSSMDNSKVYERIASITPMPKGIECPKQINPTFEISYDKWSIEKFQSLPDFIRDKMKSSLEYKEMFEGKPMNHDRDVLSAVNQELAEDAFTGNDLPF